MLCYESPRVALWIVLFAPFSEVADILLIHLKWLILKWSLPRAAALVSDSVATPLSHSLSIALSSHGSRRIELRAATLPESGASQRLSVHFQRGCASQGACEKGEERTAGQAGRKREKQQH